VDWRYGEPALDDLLSDPIVLALMRRDRVERQFLRNLIRNVVHASQPGPLQPDVVPEIPPPRVPEQPPMPEPDIPEQAPDLPGIPEPVKDCAAA